MGGGVEVVGMEEVEEVDEAEVEVGSPAKCHLCVSSRPGDCGCGERVVVVMLLLLLLLRWPYLRPPRPWSRVLTQLCLMSSILSYTPFTVTLQYLALISIV